MPILGFQHIPQQQQQCSQVQVLVQVVPDTWHIINDQDLVTRILKLAGLYKRHGQRVVVNRRGDMIVRPTLFETSMQQTIRGGTVADHQTVAYQEALVSVVTRQLYSSSRHADGLHGLLGLLKGVPQVCSREFSCTEQHGLLPDYAMGQHPL